MPTICEFFGIIITMYFREHNPPHFHARYAGKKVAIDIKTGKIIEGRMTPRALRLIEEWRNLHKDDLMLNWELAQNKTQLKSLEPLE